MSFIETAGIFRPVIKGNLSMFESQALVCEMEKLRRFAMRLTRNEAAAEDLVQSTLLRALQKKEMFTPGSNLFAWTSKILFNQFASQYRRHRKFESQYDPEPYIATLSSKPVQEATVDLAKVRETMKRMTPAHREMLVMVAIRGMGYAEVSEALQVPIGTVRSRLFRARKELKDLLEAPQLQASAREEYHRVFPNGVPTEHVQLQ